MKKILIILLLTFFANSNSFAKDGKGHLQLSDNVVRNFMGYLRGEIQGETSLQNKPMVFWITLDGTGSYHWYCPYGGCRSGDVGKQRRACENAYNTECARFARSRTVRWDNGINPKGKAARFNSKMDLYEIKSKLTSLGFYNNDDSSLSNETTEEVKPKITKKKKEETKKQTKTYELKGERSIALSWEGYDELIAGTVKFDEKNYKGTLNLPLPNNDGSCSGSYSLQTNGKGTWQIACSNDMGAAGTLKWTKGGSVTGLGRDHNDRKVKFTVSSKS